MPRLVAGVDPVGSPEQPLRCAPPVRGRDDDTLAVDRDGEGLRVGVAVDDARLDVDGAGDVPRGLGCEECPAGRREERVGVVGKGDLAQPGDGVGNHLVDGAGLLRRDLLVLELDGEEARQRLADEETQHEGQDEDDDGPGCVAAHGHTPPH